MTATTRRLRRAAVIASPATAIALSLLLDAIVVTTDRAVTSEIALSAILFNGASILLASVGAVIELRNPGHRIGRMLLVAGPLYALVAGLWITAEDLEAVIGPTWSAALNAIGGPMSYAAIGLLAGIPLLFPTGALPGPGWTLPVRAVASVYAAGLLAMVTRPGPLPETDVANPFGVPAWPAALEVLVQLVPAALLILIVLGVSGLVVRYRRGTRVERLQMRWLAAAAGLTLAGFAAVFVESALRADDGPLVSAIVGYAGILAMPIAIGVAVLRYRLYEIDRIISRTLGWAIVTALLLGVFASLVIGLQAILAELTQGETLAVAASTLVAASLFQPIRRRVQRAIDRRFDRARYDGDRAAAAFVDRLRGRVDPAGLEEDLRRVTSETLRPVAVSVWVRNVTTTRASGVP